MKSLPSLPLLVLVALLAATSTLAQGTAFTYQGYLSDKQQPAQEQRDFHARLWSQQSGGAPVSATVSHYDHPLSNGLFMIELDFGAAPFDGNPRWLELAIQGIDDDAPVVLSPRQLVAPAPYALHAAQAANLQAGVRPAFTIAGGAPFTVAATGLVANLNADLLDGLDSTAFVRRAGDSMTGNLGSPATVAVHMVRATNLFANTGTATTFRATTLGANTLNANVATASTLRVAGSQFSVDLNLSETVGLFTLHRAVKAISDSFLGTAVLASSTNGIALRGISSAGTAGYFDGSVEIHHTSPMSKPHLLVKSPGSNDFTRLRMQSGARPYWDVALGTGGGQTNSLRFYNDGGGDVVTITTNGILSTRVLTITGGADVAEPFPMTQPDLPPGSVVVIDDAQPGHLSPSAHAYDRRVAGVVSGAGGIQPGLLLRQDGVADGDQPVALAGRAYVRATAANGPIRPGDPLVSADLPGHAMKATDPDRTPGAVVGKAMGSLDAGEGLVLMLVSLQ